MKTWIKNVFLLCLVLAGFNTKSQTPPAGHFYTAADGVKVYYEDTGKGYPVLLLHGFTGTGQNWKTSAVYADLTKAGYRLIIPDLRGNGQSDHPHSDASYQNDVEIKDMMGLMSILNITQYDVVGYSRGSIIGSKLMFTDPRVKKLVMGGMGDNYTNTIWPKRLRTYGAMMGDTSIRDMDETIKRLKSKNADLISYALQQKYQPVTTPQQLATVKIPVLIIRGTEDKENGSEKILQTYIPGSKVVYTPGTHGTASKTHQFADAVTAFLKVN